MILAALIGVVLVLWKGVSLLDSVADIPLARKIVRGLMVGLGVFSLVAPGAFAEGTRQFFTAEINEGTERLMHILQPLIDSLTPKVEDAP